MLFSDKYVNGALRDMANAGGDRMHDLVVANTPIDSGNLRTSWYRLQARRGVQRGRTEYESEVRTDVEYACVFDSHTRVLTADGSKPISTVKVGDMVMTQAGDWQPVLATHSFSALEKPDLIDIRVAWRSDRDHALALTLDHKVLVNRESRSKWIHAGDLLEGDLLYHRRKAAHNKDTGVVKECEQCGRRFRTNAKRYCSMRCRDAAWAAGANPHVGMTRSEATRALIGAASRARGAGAALNRRLAGSGFVTSCEAQVEQWLIERGVPYEREFPVGDRVVDFYLPTEREIIEADGAYWHQDQSADVERDREILRALPGVEVTHIHFHDPRFSPALDPEPVPGARYVTTNPGPASFISPDEFVTTPVLGLSERRYGDVKPKSKGGLHARLYDLTIAGCHSFLANGVVISNSHVEHGTGLWGPEHKRYLIEPKKPGGWLSWVQGGERVFRKRVWHPGSPGQFMMQAAAARTEATADEVMSPAALKWARLQESLVELARARRH